jgi:hypothetical protein
MFDPRPTQSARVRPDWSLVIPVLIGSFWAALMVATLFELDELGGTLERARIARERPAQMAMPVASCGHAMAPTVTAD